MRIVIQRVSKAELHIGGLLHASMGPGLVILLGVEENDEFDDMDYLVRKIAQLRIFPDKDGVMNLSVMEVGATVMVISQFTLHASTRKGNRPSYIRAARPEKAIPLYDAFISSLEQCMEQKVLKGVFGAMMDISLVNTGPVTIIMDSKNKE